MTLRARPHRRDGFVLAAAVGLIGVTYGVLADTAGLTLAQAVAPGGTISVVGHFRRPVSLDTTPLFLKEVTLAWSNCYEHAHDGADFARAVALIDANRDLLGAVTTHTVGLDAIEHGFALAGDRRSGSVKVTVEI